MAKGKTLVAFSGKAYAGKTTCADYLESQYGFEKLSFADILKQVCKEVFLMKTKDRSLLQDVGTALRQVDKDVFVNYMEHKIKYTLSRCDTPELVKLVIDDLRYPNELKMLQRIGFTTVRLVVVPELLKERALVRDNKYMTEAQLNHISESSLDNDFSFSYMITNNEALTDLWGKLDEILGKKRSKTDD